MSDLKLPVEKAALHVPPLDEVSQVLLKGLSNNFQDVSVAVVDCPNLTEKPFMLASPGIGGSPRMTDIGGPPFLIPLVDRSKVFSFDQIAQHAELPGAFMIGAGAGPHHVVGCNCEMACNYKCGTSDTDAVNKTHIFKVKPEDNTPVMIKSTTKDFCLMGNFLLSEGKPGKVIEVKAKKRTGPENFMTCLRKTLGSHYGNQSVGLGGVFLIEKGKAKLHIMPDFSSVPLNSDVEVQNWLTFHEMNPTLICMGVLISHDPGLDMRIEHFHCFSEHGDGGHYHYDVTPDEVEYRGYFTLPEYVYRIDKPKVTHLIGRD